MNAVDFLDIGWLVLKEICRYFVSTFLASVVIRGAVRGLISRTLIRTDLLSRQDILIVRILWVGNSFWVGHNRAPFHA